MRFADEVHGGDGPGFARIDGFADAAIGEAMLDDVISLVQVANAGGDVGDALVLPEGQADLADNDPENRVSKVFKLHGCPHVLAGSQQEVVHDHVPDARPGANYGYIETVDHDMSAAEPVLMEPGDLLVFDSHLMHRSTDNESSGR